LLPQFPLDPASGAARNLRTICEMLASAGMEVECCGTTATERTRKQDVRAFLAAAGVDVRGSADDSIIRFMTRGVRYELLRTCDQTLFGRWRDEDELRHFDAMWERMLDRFRPHLVLTYGARRDDVRRHRAAQSRGCKVVFSLQNLAYKQRGVLGHVDAITACSRFTSDWYRAHVGLQTTPLPTPIDPDEVIAPRREPLFVTFVNPAVEKGLMFFARLAEELSVRRPDVPLLVVEGRATATDLIGAGLMGGFDLRRHENLMLSEPVARPRDIFAAARVLLAPSVWAEPAGRVAVEALVNGVPPIVSDRGGLPEVTAGGGFVLPLPTHLHLESPTPVEADAVTPWLDLILRLCDDESFYEQSCARAREAGRRYLPDQVGPQYLEFFAAVAGGA
jgi:glycosyltransferase involved in cell wall biosynthesis